MSDKNRINQEKKFQDLRTGKSELRFISDYFTLAKRFKKEIFNFNTSKILALGCGIGNYVVQLAEKGHFVTSIDISPKALDILRKRIKDTNLSENVSIKLMNVENLDFKKSSFDYCYGVAILHHLDLAKAIPVLKKVLKKNGELLFVEPTKYNYFVKKYRERTPDMRSDFEHPLSHDDIQLLKNNFSKVKISGCYFLQTLLPAFIRHNEHFRLLRNLFDFFDNAILKIVPFLNLYCYSVIIKIEK